MWTVLGGRRGLGVCQPQMCHWDGVGSIAAWPGTHPAQGRGGTTLRSCSQPVGLAPSPVAASARGAQDTREPRGHRVTLIPACTPVRLFEMNLGPPKTLEELDPESREYWRLLRKQNIWRHNRLSKNKRL